MPDLEDHFFYPNSPHTSKAPQRLSTRKYWAIRPRKVAHIPDRELLQQEDWSDGLPAY